MNELERMREVKRLTQQATSHVGDTCQGVVDLTLAVNILIGLVEGHRHSYDPGARNIYDRDTVEYPVTGPMQAMGGRP